MRRPGPHGRTRTLTLTRVSQQRVNRRVQGGGESSLHLFPVSKHLSSCVTHPTRLMFIHVSGDTCRSTCVLVTSVTCVGSG